MVKNSYSYLQKHGNGDFLRILHGFRIILAVYKLLTYSTMVRMAKRVVDGIITSLINYILIKIITHRLVLGRILLVSA
jgi:hypothetical protein